MALDYVNGLTTEELNSTNVVYCATFPSGKKYVGITSRKLKYRIREHKHDSRDGSEIIFHKAIAKYGFENLSWKVLDYCESMEDLRNSEVYFIKELNSFIDNDGGYNLTTGGEGATEWSEITKDRYRGSNNPASRFTEEIVKDVKQRIYNGESVAKIEREYGFEDRSFRNIANCRTWRHILPEFNDELMSRIKTPISVKDKAFEIKTLMYQGKTNIEICDMLDVNFSIVSAIRTLRRYKDLLSEYNDVISEESISRKAFSIEEVETIKRMCVDGINFKLIAEKLNYKNTQGFKTRIRDIAYVTRFVDVLPELNEVLKVNVLRSKKLEDKIEEIKTMMFEGKTDTYIAKMTNTSTVSLSEIRRLNRFKDVLSEYNEQIIKNSGKPKINFTEEQIINIKISCIEKLDYEKLGELLNCEITGGFKTRIKDIIYLKRYIKIGSEYNEELRRLYGKR